MISAWHLLWIIPVSNMLCLFAIGLTSLNKFEEHDSRFDESFGGSHMDCDPNATKQVDNGDSTLTVPDNKTNRAVKE